MFYSNSSANQAFFFCVVVVDSHGGENVLPEDACKAADANASKSPVLDFENELISPDDAAFCTGLVVIFPGVLLLPTAKHSNDQNKYRVNRIMRP